MTIRKFARATAFLLLSLAGLASLSAAGPNQTLNFALQGSPDSLDPQKTAGTLTFQVDKSIYDTLVEPDSSGKIVPALAQSWSVSADGLVWTFKLRHDVVFHNGDRFTAQDVRATLDRIRAKDTASPSVAEYAVIKDIASPDDYTVVISLSRPSAPLLSTLASGWSAILPKSLIDQNWDFSSKPVGTGPFTFKEWVRDNKITLERNPNYWQKGKPSLQTIVFNIITENAVVVQGLLSGAIDIADSLDNASLPPLQASKNIKIEKKVSPIVLVVTVNSSRPALKDVRVRQALSYAIDKQKVLDAAYNGGRIVGAFDDPSDPYYKDFSSLYPYNPSKARELLSQAGYDFNQTLDLVLPQNYDPHVKAGQIYQQYFAAVGVKTKIRLVDWSTWISDVYTKANYDLTVIGHTGKLDPDGRLSSPLYGTDATYTRWVNPTVAALITKAQATSKFEDRKKLYDQIQESFAKELPFVFVGVPVVNLVERIAISGFIKTPNLDSYDFRSTVKK